MGLLERLFGRKPDMVNGSLFETLTAYRPVFTTWGGKMYESELIRAAIDAKARHISKLRVEFKGTAHNSLRVQMKSAPNSFQTWSQFLYRLATIYTIYNTAFVVPVLDEYDEITGYFPVLPSSCEVLDVKGVPWLRYRFSNGKTACIELARCAVLTNHQCTDDLFGESNSALNSTLQLLDLQKQASEEGIKNSATFRFMAKLNNFAKPEDLSKERKRFNEENLRGESGGILLFPSTYNDIRQIESKPFLVDAEQIKTIQQNVFMYIGVNEKVLTNAAIGDDLDAFYDGAIEPFIVMLADALTLMTFTKREISNGNRIIVTSNRLQYMSTANKIALAKEMGDRGVLKIDEIRELFNYEPLPDGLGQRTPARGEYYDFMEGKADE